MNDEGQENDEECCGIGWYLQGMWKGLQVKVVGEVGGCCR